MGQELKEFDSHMYPRTYSVSRGRKLLTVLLALPLGSACLVGVWYYGTRLAGGTAAVVSSLLAASAAAAVWFIASILKRQLVLTADALQIRGVFTHNVVQRSTIRQFRILSRSGILELEIAEPVADRTHKVKVHLGYQFDEAFADWFEGLHNPDVVEMVESIREVEGDSVSHERIASLNRARQFARYFQLAALAVVVWALLYPRPYSLVLLLLVIEPWLTLYLCWRYPLWFSVGDHGDGNVRADLTLCLFVPGAALALRAVLDVQLVELSSLLLPALLGLLVLLACILWIEPEYRKSWIKVVPLVLLLTAYPAGSIALLNTALDWQQPAVQRLEVLAKSKPGNSNRVTVPAWGPYQTDNSVEVPSDLYTAVPVGGAVCLYRYPGALGLDWYRIEAADHC
jgi:hypothetical protein